MSIPKTTSAVVISTPSGGVDSLKLITQDLPELGPGDVLVKMRAVSLNYRDYSIPNGVYPFREFSGNLELHIYICHD